MAVVMPCQSLGRLLLYLGRTVQTGSKTREALHEQIVLLLPATRSLHSSKPSGAAYRSYQTARSLVVRSTGCLSCPAHRPWLQGSRRVAAVALESVFLPSFFPAVQRVTDRREAPAVVTVPR
jgi:hypothetical protein